MISDDMCVFYLRMVIENYIHFVFLKQLKLLNCCSNLIIKMLYDLNLVRQRRCLITSDRLMTLRRCGVKNRGVCVVWKTDGEESAKNRLQTNKTHEISLYIEYWKKQWTCCVHVQSVKIINNTSVGKMLVSRSFYILLGIIDMHFVCMRVRVYTLVYMVCKKQEFNVQISFLTYVKL